MHTSSAHGLVFPSFFSRDFPGIICSSKGGRFSASKKPLIYNQPVLPHFLHWTNSLSHTLFSTSRSRANLLLWKSETCMNPSSSSNARYTLLCVVHHCSIPNSMEKYDHSISTCLFPSIHCSAHAHLSDTSTMILIRVPIYPNLDADPRGTFP